MKPWIRIGQSVHVGGKDIYNNGRVRIKIGGLKLKGLSGLIYMQNRRAEYPEEFDERKAISYEDLHPKRGQSFSGDYTTPRKKKKRKR